MTPQEAARKVVEGFETGVFVRGTKHDGQSDWAIRLWPYLRALGALAKWCEETTPNEPARPATPAGGEEERT